ncbi:MAG TPA: ABC transporter permease, partial [Thermoanaerobaculia bacterium]
MLGIPLKYNIRNLFVRRVTTTLTVLGIGLVVTVFLSVMALGEGISKVFTTSGSDKNVLVLRQNSQSELQSGIGLDQVPLVLTLPGIEKDADGKPLASAELNIVLNLEKVDGGSSNVTLRGVQEKAMRLRANMKLTEGRMF